jgi:hypothetical protein
VLLDHRSLSVRALAARLQSSRGRRLDSSAACHRADRSHVAALPDARPPSSGIGAAAPSTGCSSSRLSCLLRFRTRNVGGWAGSDRWRGLTAEKPDDLLPDLVPKYMVTVGTRWYLLGLTAAPPYQRVPIVTNSHKHNQDSNSLGGTTNHASPSVQTGGARGTPMSQAPHRPVRLRHTERDRQSRDGSGRPSRLQEPASSGGCLGLT